MNPKIQALLNTLVQQRAPIRNEQGIIGFGQVDPRMVRNPMTSMDDTIEAINNYILNTRGALVLPKGKGKTKNLIVDPQRKRDLQWLIDAIIESRRPTAQYDIKRSQEEGTWPYQI